MNFEPSVLIFLLDNHGRICMAEQENYQKLKTFFGALNKTFIYLKQRNICKSDKDIISNFKVSSVTPKQKQQIMNSYNLTCCR